MTTTIWELIIFKGFKPHELQFELSATRLSCVAHNMTHRFIEIYNWTNEKRKQNDVNILSQCLKLFDLIIKFAIRLNV